jgi:hypothetical protein
MVTGRAMRTRAQQLLRDRGPRRPRVRREALALQGVEYVESPEFDELIVQCVRLEVETKRQEEMIERSRSSVGAWAADQGTAARG